MVTSVSGTRWLSWGGVLARLVLGGVWLAAGLLKIGDPAESVRAVRAYDLLPESLVLLVGYSLPVLEVVLGLALVLGLMTRWMGVVSAVLLVMFVIGVASAWARGMSIECGCFGGGGGPAEGARDKYPWELARDAGLLALSGWLVMRPRTPWALDSYVLPGVPARATPRVAPRAATASSEAARGRRGGSRAERTRHAQQAADIRRRAAIEELHRRNRVITIGVLVAMLAVVAVGSGLQSSRDTTGEQAVVPTGMVDSYAVPFGPDDAPVVVDVYEDFLCPFCADLEAASAPLVEKYADSDVQFRYHVIAFLDRASTTRYSTRAANALAAVLDTSGREVAKEFHDAVFAEQPPEGGPGLSDDRLIELAVDAGAEEWEVADAIRDKVFEQWVRNATDAASRSGVNTTPTVFVNGNVLAPAKIPQTVAALEAAIEKALTD